MHHEPTNPQATPNWHDRVDTCISELIELIQNSASSTEQKTLYAHIADGLFHQDAFVNSQTGNRVSAWHEQQMKDWVQEMEFLLQPRAEH